MAWTDAVSAPLVDAEGRTVVVIKLRPKEPW